MALASVSDIAAAHDAGQACYRSFRKVPTQATGNGIWFDLSMSPGNPVPNYYAAAPLVSVALARSTDGGLDHGPNVAPAAKMLRKLRIDSLVATAAPLPLILCDYLLYYPFVDMSVVGDQAMAQGAALPRYADGRGVQLMAVEVAAQVGGAPFYVTYTNQDGTAGRVSATMTCNAQAVNGTIVTSAPATAGASGNPFVPLQSGDSGVRSVQSVTFLSGDVGLLALVLVRPLASLLAYGTDAPAEVDFVTDRAAPPAIVDDAYLNLLACPRGTLAAAPINGAIETLWG